PDSSGERVPRPGQFHGSASLRSGTPSAFDRILRPRSVQSKRMRQESAHPPPGSAAIPNRPPALPQVIVPPGRPSRLNEGAGGSVPEGRRGRKSERALPAALADRRAARGVGGVPLVFGDLWEQGGEHRGRLVW